MWHTKLTVLHAYRLYVGGIDFWPAVLRQTWRPPEGQPTVLFPDSYVSYRSG